MSQNPPRLTPVHCHDHHHFEFWCTLHLSSAKKITIDKHAPSSNSPSGLPFTTQNFICFSVCCLPVFTCLSLPVFTLPADSWSDVVLLLSWITNSPWTCTETKHQYSAKNHWTWLSVGFSPALLQRSPLAPHANKLACLIYLFSPAWFVTIPLFFGLRFFSWSCYKPPSQGPYRISQFVENMLFMKSNFTFESKELCYSHK